MLWTKPRRSQNAVVPTQFKSTVQPFPSAAVWRPRQHFCLAPLQYIASQCIDRCVVPRDLVAASSTPLVLSILAEGESYGYAIIQRVRELSAEEIQWTDGMLYPVLHRLERDELITAEWRQAESGRERKYYRLTTKGRNSLKQEKANWLTVHNTLGKLWNLQPVST